jgi:hypothetical protein
MLSQLREHFCKVWDQITYLLRLDHDVINVRLNYSPYES